MTYHGVICVEIADPDYEKDDWWEALQGKYH